MTVKAREVTPKFVHNGGGFVTEVKNELSEGGGAWKQMTSQAGPMTVKARLDPYSKVVLSEAGLGLGGIEYGQVPISGGYEYNIPVTNTILSSSPYTLSQSSPDSQALADLNISSPGQSYQPEVSHSDLVKILGQEATQDDEMQNLSDKLDEFSLGHGAQLNISPVTASTSRVGGKRSSKEAENDSASILIQDRWSDNSPPYQHQTSAPTSQKYFGTAIRSMTYRSTNSTVSGLYLYIVQLVLFTV